jgi:exodeoxyribonuclease VII small subunit
MTMTSATIQPAPAPDITALSFEKALEELEGIVRRLEQGSVPLEESLTIYERGEALKKHCEVLLQRAEARIEKITVGPSGEAVGAAPLDVGSQNPS